MAEQSDVDLLNQLLLGRHMGLDSINDHVKATQDTSLSSRLITIARTYERQIGELKQRIHDLGGDPEESRGMVGIMRSAVTKGKLLFNAESGAIVHDILDGEQMGIDEEEKILAQLSPASRDLVNRQLQENRQVLQQLRSLDQRYNHLG